MRRATKLSKGGAIDAGARGEGRLRYAVVFLDRAQHGELAWRQAAFGGDLGEHLGAVLVSALQKRENGHNLIVLFALGFRHADSNQ